jgi:putative flavoprotein involved in K+ transport
MLIASPAVLTAGGIPRALGGRAAALGLYFVGYSITLGGALRAAGVEARHVARAITREKADLV